MIFKSTKLRGAYIIEVEHLWDERGCFARTFCVDEFVRQGLAARWVQCNISFNRERGTLRGIHYQIGPYEEAKLVRCTRGAICDVIIDLRRESPTFKQYMTAELTADNHRMLYVPEGCGHGFLTQVDDAEVFYQMSEAYSPEHAKGVRWDDPVFGIPWSAKPRIISDQDRAYPDFMVA